jgi:biotin carboxyl carrier protein
MKYHVTIGDRTFEVDLTSGQPVLDGRDVPAELLHVAGTPIRHLLVGSRSRSFLAVPGASKGSWRLDFGGHPVEVEALDERSRAIREMGGDAAVEGTKTVTAPMPGLIVRIHVEVGQAVEAGQGLIVVEAMKMENEMKAPVAGTVARIDVSPGQVVEKGAVLVILE